MLDPDPDSSQSGSTTQAKNEAERKFVKRNEAKYFFLFASKRKIRSETKRKQAKKLLLDFRLSKRKQSETDPVSLRFALKRKKFLSETGAPYFKLIKIEDKINTYVYCF
jgi:hypothetical protein